ncbi:MAG: DUF2892 domain-containing protein [Saprospiraceae bacterium]|nr:DUF2892 domain-containing protein [Saprospiraceae bacterium]
MGTTDKMIRLGVAIIIALLFFLDKISGTTAIVLGAIAVIFALTSLVSFCPLYTLIGVNSCEVKK